MYFKQLVKEDLGCASYIVGCSNAGSCVVVDPRLDMVDEILALTATKDLQINAIIETHNHADHVSGHGELASRSCAPIYVHELANVSFPHRKLQDGDELTCGAVTLRVIHTPGHRPEHIALSVSDTSRSTDPWLLLTGDSLLIGDVARPDLVVSGQEGAAALYRSLFERLLEFEDGVEIYPAHVAGSLCGRAMNLKTSSTIGFERRHNPALASCSRSAFIQDLSKYLPSRPPNMSRIVERNCRNYLQFAAPLAPLALDLEHFQCLMADGALVIDARSPRQFCRCHIPGALHVSLRGRAFANRVGFVIPVESRLLLVLENDADLSQATEQLLVVGYEQVIGYLIGGMDSWQASGLPVQELAQLSVCQLYAEREHLTILDVREPQEWAEGHIEGALHMPYYTIEARQNELDPAQPLAILCSSGQRSAIACSLFQSHNFQKLYNIIGGMEVWRQSGLPEVK